MNTFVHVGYRKTATSWLQKMLFPTLPINYIGKTEKYYPRWMIEWHYSDDYFFKAGKNRIKDAFAANQQADRPNLISSEAFTNTSVIYSQAERIKDICPLAKIIVTLRDPVDMVWSHYTHDVSEGDCFVDIEDWLDWGRTPFVLHKRKTIYLPDFFFDEAISYYIELFGKDNVCVLKMEDMLTNRERFFGDLYRFLGVTSALPDDHCLSIKINQSNNIISNISEMKWRNFLNKLERDFPGLHEELKGAEGNKYATGMSEMPSGLRERLVAYFKGKTFGYY